MNTPNKACHAFLEPIQGDGVILLSHLKIFLRSMTPGENLSGSLSGKSGINNFWGSGLDQAYMNRGEGVPVSGFSSGDGKRGTATGMVAGPGWGTVG